MFYALKQAVKKVCPEFILTPYRRIRRALYIRRIRLNNLRWVKLRNGGVLTL